MTQPNAAQPPARPQAIQRPTGWPVGSFNSYAEAQAAVDALSDQQFPVEALTIVGVDLMQVEKVTGRLTWGRVLGGGALSGLWMGLFVGLLFAIFSPNVWASLFSAIIIGVIFGLIFAAVGYSMTQGKRDFSSMTTIVAGRYDVLCESSQAPRARDMIAQMGRAQQAQQAQQQQPQQPQQPQQQPVQQQPQQQQAPAQNQQPQQTYRVEPQHGSHGSQSADGYGAQERPEYPER